MKITCRLSLKLDNGERGRIDWSWKESFNDFLEEAIKIYPNVIEISMDCGGYQDSLWQGDLDYGTWEKHDGKWNKIKYAEGFFINYGPPRLGTQPFKTLIPCPELDEIERKVKQ